jgi:hypothetical protein
MSLRPEIELRAQHENIYCLSSDRQGASVSIVGFVARRSTIRETHSGIEETDRNPITR